MTMGICCIVPLRANPEFFFDVAVVSSLKWPKWHSFRKDHWLGEVSKLHKAMIAEIKKRINSRRKVDSKFVAAMTSVGSLFQMSEAAITKARLPTVDSFTCGTTRRLVLLERSGRWSAAVTLAIDVVAGRTHTTRTLSCLDWVKTWMLVLARLCTLATSAKNNDWRHRYRQLSSQAYDLVQVNRPQAATVYVNQINRLPPCRSSIPQTWCVVASGRHDVD